MAENATVRLFDNQGTADRRAIVLVGTRPGAGGDVTLQSVVVTRPSATPETYSVVGTGPVPPVVPAAYLDETNGAGDLRLRRGSAPGTVAAALTFSAATPTAPVIFFGKAFDAAGGVDLRLVLGLPGPPVAGAEPPVASLSCRGSVEAIAGGTIFSAVPLEFQVLFDDLPSVFPSQGTPGLALGLPSEIPWPSLRLPWPTFPNLPTLPLRLPAFSISLAPLPIRAGWKAIEVGIATDGVATVHVEQFVLEGIGSKVGGSFDLVFSVAGGVDVQNPVFDGLNNLPNLSYKGLGPGCFGFDWKNCPATPLLRLVSTELNDPTSAAGNSFHLRINAPGGRLREVRLDWDAGAAVREIDLPGFGVSLPAPRMVSLIALRPDEVGVHSESTRVTLAATFEAGAKVQAFSTFSWPVGDTDREKFRDGTGKPSDKLITVTATAKNPVSLVLVDLPLEPGGSPPRFVQQLATPLGTFGDQEASGGVDDGGDLVRALFDSSPATPMNLIGLSAKDWSLSLDIDPTFADGITLPFLNQGGSQFLKLKVKKTQSDPNTLALSCAVEVNLSIGDALTFSSQVRLGFNLERMAFEVDHDQGLWLTMDKAQTGSFLGLTWSITPSPNEQVIPGSVGPGNLGGTKVKNAAFVLVTKNRNYELRQAPGSVIEIRYDRATTPDEPIIFRVSEFALTPRGVDLKAEVTDTPARFNGLETQFRFTSGTLQLHESRLAGFTIAGSGPLPPALVGDAVADVALQFAQAPDGGTVRLVRGSAHIKGSNLLRCQASRFEFALDGLGLEFVEDGGADHLYFTLSGRARYAPLPGDDSSGPLAWLPKIEIQLVDCPLTGNMRVIAQHIKFLVELPKKQTFDLLGCFQMELRGIGFVPQFDKLSPGDPTSAMQLSGQIMFAEGGGDVLETKVDFHDLFVALPARGSFVPRVYCKGIGIHIKQGETFELSGEVDFFNGEQVDKNPDGTPIIGDGFAGQGSLQIQGLPRLSATFAFLRVSPDGALTWKRAWFLYVEAGELSLMIPVIQIYIREIGLGFGYRYTLASIRTTDEINDPRKLLKELQRLSKTQGNLSSRDSWRIDLEGPGDSARWTVALRAMISQTSSQAGPFGDYVAEAESLIACLFLIDVVVALRSDLTFFMAGRAWVNTNYNDFLLNKGIADDDGNLRNRPLFSAFVLLSPRQKRFLANLSSNHDAAFGGHPPLPGFIKGAIRSSKFTATLLVEPDLFHLELGWPNQLQWNGDLGPLQVQFQGGAIFRVSETELVVGNSFLARGSLDIKAGFDAGFIGASLKAFASVAYGARYIGVLAFHDPFNNSAFYGAIGIEIHVSVSIEFWIKLELLFTTVKLGFSFSFAIGFTAALEVGIMIDPLNLLADVPAMRGTATISLEIMGHSVEFDVRLAFQGDKLNRAIAITEKFLNVGLEAEDVQPVPGTTGAGAPRVASTRMLTSLSIARGVRSAPLLAAPAPATGTDSAAFAAAIAEGPKPPSAYSLVAIDATGFVGSGADAGKKRRYVLLFPAASGSGKPPRFFPVPPSDVVLPAVTGDLEWTFPAPGASVHFEHFDPASGDFRDVPAGAPLGWKVDWAYDRFLLEGLDSTTGASKPPPKLSLQKILTHAYLTKTNGAVIPVGDPPPLASFDQSLEDDRVHNPTEAAYEAAVRGAFAQVASPYFKFDEQSPYDQGLKSAFNKDTTVYHSSGSLVGLSAAATREVDEIKRSVQLRGTVLHKMFRDVQRFAILEGHTDAASIREAADLRRDSLAFRFGVVFRATGVESEVRWLESGAGTLRQRSAVDSKAVDSAAIPVGQFNNQDDGFVARPPAFRKVRKYEHANMVAIAWELHREGGAGLDDDLEHHLSHYRVHRLHLDGNDPEAEFTVKKGTVLHRDSTGPIGILPRFQMVDRFDTETGADVAALTDEGKTYLYTITPVDLAGNQSPRPLSVVSTRLPSDPPLVPTDGELVVEYALADDPATFPATLPTMPRIRDADVKVTFQWSDPPAPAGAVVPPVDRYRLVFRREAALPVGFFGADHDTRGGRTAGFPVTNARSLRTDRVLEFGKNDPGRDRSDVFDPETGAHLRADTGRTVQQVTLTLGELGDLGVLPADRSWQPDSWRVFAQAVTRPRGVSGEGVPSALAAVAVRLRFVPKIPTVTTVTALPAPVSTAGTHLILPFEERKVGLLEWLPDPIRFNLLPPEDETSLAGFAQVPMPLLDEKKTAQWIYPLSTPLGASPPGLRFELHPERFRSLQMTWNQGPSGLPNYPIELHAKYQLFEFDADAQTGETLDVPPGVTTLDFGTWARDANLRLVQEVELLPAEDLPLVPSDTSHPLAWDVWSPARSRRIVLRRQMIEARTWPETTDRTKLGPWYSWRDSYLRWPVRDPQPPTGPGVPAFPQLPPAFDPVTQRLLPFHALFRGVVQSLLDERETPAGPGLPPTPALFTVELSTGPVRGDVKKNPDPKSPAPTPSAPGGGKPVNPSPASDASTGLSGFLRANAPETDPHGWGILQRMGLSVAFRVRLRKTGDYVLGKPLADLIQKHLNLVFSRFNFPDVQNLKPYLHVEYLFQAGARNRLGVDEKAPGGLPDYDGLLAMVRLSLCPVVTQRMRYQVAEVTGVDPGTAFKLTLRANSLEMSYQIKTGTPGIATLLPKGTAVVTEPVVPKGGTLLLLFRGKFDLSVSIVATKTDGSPMPAATVHPFRPTEWEAAFFSAPPEAPWADDVDVPAGVADPEKQSPKLGWARFGQYLQDVRADLSLPTPAEGDGMALTLGWLDRFFSEGGDIALPVDDLTPAATGPGPWVASAYPRAATPIALTPDPAGRITYYHTIEDLWGHVRRYYLRPQGRYDMLWAAISSSTRLFDVARGVLGRRQAQIDPPEPGGMDVVLDRIRPLAAPLVLSSRRLDPPAAPSQTVPPGATWEVIVAKHSEQSLVEKNRGLANHLAFRQVAHSLVRSLSEPEAVDNLGKNLTRAVSGAFGSAVAPVPGKYKLVVGQTTFPIDLVGANTLDQLAARINASGAGVTASVTAAGARVPFFLLMLSTAATTTPRVRLLTGDGPAETNLVSEPVALSEARFEAPVNSVPKVSPKQLEPPGLPGTPARLDHLDLKALDSDDALSIDLPLRSTQFSQGIVALQWRALPYYYQYKLLLIAQAAAVVSPITTVDHRDFQYISPAPEATMEGTVDADGVSRRRKITVRLARYWDCLPDDAQRRWPSEDPASVEGGDPKSTKFRHSALPDPGVIYQVILTMPSRNVEVLAEFRADPSSVSGYASRPLPGPFQGDAVRLLPAADVAGIGSQFIRLETLLTQVSGPNTDNADVSEPISGRRAFAKAADVGGAVTFPATRISACVLRLVGDLPPSSLAAFSALIAASDSSFAPALRQILAQPGPDRYAEACIGLEQLAEVHQGVTIDANARTVTWKGSMSADELSVLTSWRKSSLFQTTIANLIGFQSVATYPADPKNPVQADTTIPASRLTIAADRLTWSQRLTLKATPAELAALAALKAKPGLPPNVVAAITTLIADVSDHEGGSATIPIAETFWKPRVTQETLPAELKDRLLVGNAVIGFHGLMTRAEGQSLQGLAGLGAPDRAAVARLFVTSLNGGLGGGTLEIRARRGSAAPASSAIEGVLPAVP